MIMKLVHDAPLAMLLGALGLAGLLAWLAVGLSLRLRLRWLPLARVSLQDSYRYLASCERFGVSASEGAVRVNGDPLPSWHSGELVRLASGLGAGTAPVLVNDPAMVRVDVSLAPVADGEGRRAGGFWIQAADGYVAARRQYPLLLGTAAFVVFEVLWNSCFLLITQSLFFPSWLQGVFDSMVTTQVGFLEFLQNVLEGFFEEPALWCWGALFLLGLALVLLSVKLDAFSRAGALIHGRRFRLSAMRADLADLAGDSGALSGGAAGFPDAQSPYPVPPLVVRPGASWAAAWGRTPAPDPRVPATKWAYLAFALSLTPGLLLILRFCTRSFGF